MQAIDRQELIKLRTRLDELIARSGEQPDPFRVVEIHDKVIEFTKSIFAGEPRIDVVQDPEFGNSMFVVRIEARGDVDELARLSSLWHHGLHNAAQELAIHYCLLLIPTDES
ncbi:MAG: hypothetical protein ACREUU_00235 [Gammaproteobacteria bacterium]